MIDQPRRTRRAPKTAARTRSGEGVRGEARASRCSSDAVLRRRRVRRAEDDAAKYGLKTVADLKKVPNLRRGLGRSATSVLPSRHEAVYGLTKIKYVPLGTIPVTTLIDQGKVTGGDVFSTEPELASGKYVVLTDKKHIFGFQNVAPEVSKKLVTALGRSSRRR